MYFLSKDDFNSYYNQVKKIMVIILLVTPRRASGNKVRDCSNGQYVSELLSNRNISATGLCYSFGQQRWPLEAIDCPI